MVSDTASLTEGCTYFSCVHFTIYIGNIRELFNPDGPSVPIV